MSFLLDEPRDTNGDECLEPEETELVVGNDCGAWFVRDELTEQEGTDPQPSSGGQPSSRTFALVQSKALKLGGDTPRETIVKRAFPPNPPQLFQPTATCAPPAPRFSVSTGIRQNWNYLMLLN